jgi:hypothetical protein
MCAAGARVERVDLAPVDLRDFFTAGLRFMAVSSHRVIAFAH